MVADPEAAAAEGAAEEERPQGGACARVGEGFMSDSLYESVLKSGSY